MPLDLVPRSARIFSAHLNKYYRVLKGIDPESVSIRLLNAGAFEIRHSVTNAPMLHVDDTGVTGSIAGASIVDGSITAAELGPDSVTSAKIADGSIVNADVSPSAMIVPSKLWGGGTPNRVLGTTDGTVLGPVQVSSPMIATLAVGAAQVMGGGGADTVLRTTNGTNCGFGKVVTNDMGPNTISGDRIADGTITSAKLAGGIPVPAGSITSTEIADGGIATVDLAPNAVTQVGIASGVSSAPGISAAPLVQMPDMSVSLTTTGGRVLMWFHSAFQASTVPSVLQYAPYMDNALAGNTTQISIQTASAWHTIPLVWAFTPSAGPHTFQIYWGLTSGGGNALGTWRQLVVMEVKR